MTALPINKVLNGKHGQYRVMQRVGGGGMALVFRVEEVSSGKQWALKMLHLSSNKPEDLKEARDLFQQEAELLTNLDHLHLPKVVDHFDESKQSFLVMEFIEGETLEKHLEIANRPLPEIPVLRWMVQICEVLDYLHNQKPAIIFRDLKPGNIMLSNDGVIKLIDFGIARTYKPKKKKDTVSMGSANYAPLEQWGKGQTDARSDVYALGATMYHLLTDELPPLASEPTFILPTDIYPALSLEIEQIILKAMQIKPNDRYQSAKEMQQALKDCLASLGVSAEPAPAPTPSVPSIPLPAPSVPSPPLPAVTPPPAPWPRPKVAIPVSPPPIVHPQPTAQPASPAATPTCPACGHAHRAGARFCGQCGGYLSGQLKGILDIMNSGIAVLSLPLSKSPFVIGRESPEEGFMPDLNLLPYDAQFISRRHAQIMRHGKQFTITDLGSSNSTFVNKKRLIAHKSQPMRSGDQIMIGKVHLRFRLTA